MSALVQFVEVHELVVSFLLAQRLEVRKISTWGKSSIRPALSPGRMGKNGNSPSTDAPRSAALAGSSQAYSTDVVQSNSSRVSTFFGCPSQSVPGPELFQDPAELPERRVSQPIADSLWTGALLLRSSRSPNHYNTACHGDGGLFLFRSCRWRSPDRAA